MSDLFGVFHTQAIGNESESEADDDRDTVNAARKRDGEDDADQHADKKRKTASSPAIADSSSPAMMNAPAPVTTAVVPVKSVVVDSFETQAEKEFSAASIDAETGAKVAESGPVRLAHQVLDLKIAEI